MGLYGEPCVDKRIHFWSYFASIHNTIDLAWIDLRDYNQILHPSEKVKGVYSNLNLVNNCRNILYSLQLSDLGYNGSDFI